MPKVSIIVPVYNVELYLDRCVQSIESQTYSKWELLLIDDGSHDRSGELCDKWEKKDDRIQVFHGPNRGVSIARNIGLDKAEGDWVLFVDSDDWIKEECLEECVNEAEANDLDFFQFGTMRIDDVGNQLYDFRMTETGVCNASDYIIKQGRSFKANISGCFIKKSIIDDNHIQFDERVKHGEDQIFIISTMLASKRIKATEAFYYYYYNNDTSATRHYNFQEMYDSSVIYLDYIKSIPQLKWKLCVDFIYIITLWFGQKITSIQLDKLNLLWDKYKYEIELAELLNMPSAVRVFLSLRWLGFRTAWHITNNIFVVIRTIKHVFYKR